MPFIFKRYGSRKFIFYWLSEFILMFGIGLAAAHIRLTLDNGGVFSYDPAFLKTIVLSLTYMTAFYSCPSRCLSGGRSSPRSR